MEKVEGVKRKEKGKESRLGRRYGFELKLRCVKLRVEAVSVALISKEVGVNRDVIYRWVKAYREQGEAGLRNRVRSSGSRQKLPGPVRKKINQNIPWRMSFNPKSTHRKCNAVSLS